MGYELHLTRADQWPDDQHWSEGRGVAITFAEWERLVEGDDELAVDYRDRLTEDELRRLVDETPELAGCRRGDGFEFSREQGRRLSELAEQLKAGARPDPEAVGCDAANWTAHPRGEQPCFWFRSGMISTKSPDAATLGKMLRLAERLAAVVRGDDGEVYRRSGRGFDCFEPGRGWVPLEEYHRGRPDWAPAIIREMAQESQ